MVATGFPPRARTSRGCTSGSVPPCPSCPHSFAPKVSTEPPSMISAVKNAPHATASTLTDRSAGTRFGRYSSPPAWPMPSCPSPFAPNSHSRPFADRAAEWPTPAATDRTDRTTGTRAGKPGGARLIWAGSAPVPQPSPACFASSPRTTSSERSAGFPKDEVLPASPAADALPSPQASWTAAALAPTTRPWPN
eukprot:scaffold36274_cov125-Isochrysis_galbana.AAC.15